MTQENSDTTPPSFTVTWRPADGRYVARCVDQHPELAVAEYSAQDALANLIYDVEKIDGDEG